ncbi:phosphoglycerate mutase-like protein 4 [Phalaenopsis equestris]|uniref:phosphoglycerate mutase-like protein 4 n=1 Tax=Phalaenopsis equestris TaxID=78828 RepID=UPI0009E5DEE6|nr:phosphoglycerate mutase-like protein 4 [Phalaenopsis equestris]
MAAVGDCNGSAKIFTEVVLVRHGETTWNASRILQGHSDSELNDIGRQQAVAVASHLSKQEDFIAIYSSDLQRAAETARIIASRCNLPEVILDPSLRERHLGELQGLTMRDAQKQKPIAYKHFLSAKRDQELPGGGESLAQLHERCTSFLENLAWKHRGERIIVVTHGGVLRELYRRARPMGPLNGHIKNTSVNVIHIHEDGQKWTIKKWGDVSHLQQVGAQEDAFGGDRTSG